MFVALLLALAVDAAPAAPSTETPPAPTAAAAPAAAAPNAKDGDEVVCKSEQVTGSRFPKKVCRRKVDMERERAEQQDRLRSEQRPGGMTTH